MENSSDLDRRRRPELNSENLFIGTLSIPSIHIKTGSGVGMASCTLSEPDPLGPPTRPTFLGASVLTPAPHSLCTAPRGPVWPMHHIGGLCMCRADQWLAIGLHTIQWTTEAWLAAAGTHFMGLGADWPDPVPRLRSGWASSTMTGACPVVPHV